MGQKKTFYFSDDDMVIHDKAKKYAKELSPVVVNGLKEFVAEKEREELGMEDLVIFIGKKYVPLGITEGKMIKFTGRKLATDTMELGSEYNLVTIILYFSKKGKYLILSESINQGEITTSYYTCDTVQELLKRALPEPLLNAAVANDPGMAIEELDI